jgi:hypothetical protein
MDTLRARRQNCETYIFSFGLGPPEQLPPFDRRDEQFEFLQRLAQRYQRDDPEAEVKAESGAEMQRQLEQEASRWVRQPIFKGRVPPLTWALAEDSKEAIAYHFQQCGPWAVRQLQEISKLGLHYSRPGIAVETLSSSPASTFR